MVDNCLNTKLSGYLEKKGGRMKMIHAYKRYWFVLEGRLLLYYRSKDEYKAISPCKGSINLGPPCTVQTCSSTSEQYAFQVETRTATVTLKADNREDQNRWMQGIMFALNQHSQSAKLCHFRYSLDELPLKTANKSNLKKKNSILFSRKKSNNDEDILTRLQKKGAYSYSEGLCRKNELTPKCDNSGPNSNNIAENRIPSELIIENDQYDAFCKNIISTDIEMKKDINNTDNIYERMPRDSLILLNEKERQYAIVNNNIKNTSVSPKQSCEKLNVDSENFPVNNLSFENEKLFPLDIVDRKPNSCVVKPRQHISKNSIASSSESETIFLQAKTQQFSDYREHAALTTALKELELTEKNNNISRICLEKQEQKSQINSDLKSKLKKEKTKKPSKSNVTMQAKDLKLKKKSSFIRKVWKKKTKNQEKDKSDEELYETVPASVVEKHTIPDDTAVQLLSELQNILEDKVPLLLEQYSKCNTKIEENRSIATTEVSKSQNSQNNEILHDTSNLNQLPRETFMIDNSIYYTHEIETIRNNSSPNYDSDKKCPLLPPRNIKSPSYCKDENSEREEDSLDEILEDLCTTKNKTQKVKTMVDQFNKTLTYPDIDLKFEVPKIKESKTKKLSREEGDPEELNKMLQELAMVTSAPLLNSRGTNSLITHNDNELTKLLPIRKRRYSDPDYDIPRSHQSFMNKMSNEISFFDNIESTRFLGPISNSSNNILSKKFVKNSINSPQPLSITPDSLELEVKENEKCTSISRVCEYEETLCTTQNYLQLHHCNINRHGNNRLFQDGFKNVGHCKCFDIMVQNNIYGCKEQETSSIKLLNNKEEEFIDSLEINNKSAH